MSYEIKGKVCWLGETQKGIGKSGDEWQKHEFAIRTEGEYPKEVCFETWGDKTRYSQKLILGQDTTVSFDPQSRYWEEGGKYFTSLRAWKIAAGDAPEQTHAASAMDEASSATPEGPSDDLPF